MTGPDEERVTMTGPPIPGWDGTGFPDALADALRSQGAEVTIVHVPDFAGRTEGGAVLDPADTETPAPGPVYCPECGGVTEPAQLRDAQMCAECTEARNREPVKYDGTVSITWPAPNREFQQVNGWQVALHDEAGDLIVTAMRVTVHADLTGPVWAELEFCTKPDGSPAIRREDCPVKHQGHVGMFPTATFRYLVSAMTIRERAATG